MVGFGSLSPWRMARSASLSEDGIKVADSSRAHTHTQATDPDRLLQACADLNDTRKMLIIRQDESMTHLRARIAATEEFSKALQELRTLPLEMTQITALLSKLNQPTT